MIERQSRDRLATQMRRLLCLTTILFISQIALAEPLLPRPKLPGGSRPGSLDLRFDPTQRGRALGLTGGQPTAMEVVSQPDGKVLLGGWFDGVNGRLRNNIARLNADGNIDPDFKAGYGFDGTVTGLALQPDGKVIAIGSFGAVNGRSQPLIARLKANGKVDPSFHCRLSGDANLRLTGVAVRQDGKIWIGGQFTNVNGTARLNLARLNPDGSLDATFDAAILSVGTNVFLDALQMQADEKLLVAGAWTGTSNSLLRLNADGSLDNDFASITIASPISGFIRDIACNSNGAIAIVGLFSTVNGQTRPNVARLTASGALDAGFVPGAGADYNFLWTVLLQPDGKIIVGGNFKQFSGVDRMGIARLNENGSLDAGFDPGNAAGVAEGFYPSIRSLALDANGGVLAAGDAWWEGTSTNAVFRLQTSGQRDAGFVATLHGPIEEVTRAVLQRNGRMIIGVAGTTGSKLLRLNANGSRDASFVAGTNVPVIHAMALQANGDLLVGTTEFAEPQTGVLLRLKPNGAVDTNFHAPRMVAGEVPIESIAVQPDGRILVGGLIWEVDGHRHQGIVRLNSDGSFDESFEPVPIGVTDDGGYGVEHIFVTRNGNILIAGGFTWQSGEGGGIALLGTNGAVDAGFSNKVERVLYVSSAALQRDGKLVLSAVSYAFEQGVDIFRINPDGSRDDDFKSAIRASSLAVAVQSDGRILVAPGANGSGIGRLERDGALDRMFQSDLNGASVRTILLQRDGRIIISGRFHGVSGIPMHGIARLNNQIKQRGRTK